MGSPSRPDDGEGGCVSCQRVLANALSSGVIRQDGRGGPAASCLVYGFTLTV